MGLLDDAIREHLELKWGRGAPREGIDREEHGAFGAPTHGPGPAGVVLPDEPVTDARIGTVRGGEPDARHAIAAQVTRDDPRLVAALRLPRPQIGAHPLPHAQHAATPQRDASAEIVNHPGRQCTAPARPPYANRTFCLWISTSTTTGVA